jgi:ammonia channel protein AmtB
VYYPVAHWVWGQGWLYKLGARDFAGGIVIHTTAGTGALVLALFLGRRRDFDKYVLQNTKYKIQRNKETKKQRNKETKKQRNKETKKQRNKEKISRDKH